ncbi:MAG: beta-N-acetylhexosaminidase [Gammaproteobacteria bacterium]|nr:MAG: beta-N-acetylhexosaminidase [Gammaproteobacteria bacterium]
MSLGPIMLDVAGFVLTDEERQRLQHPSVGAVILFSRNYESPRQLMALIQDIHAQRTPRLLVAVDHEGGRVQRFREGFSALPAARIFGDIYDEHPRRGRDLAEAAGWLMAVELLSVGVDFSFAPVLDLDRGVSSVIGDRAFHSNPEIVAELAHSYMVGMHNAGMAATGKHFPGHGAVKEDSHHDLPVDDREYQDIAMEDIVPFERMVHYGLAAVMPAHVLYKNVDSRPAGFSRFWLQEVLRNRLQFQGVIFSDDLSMAGAHAQGTIVERADAALDAGCDMVLVCNDAEAANELVRNLEVKDNPASLMRLVRMHGRGEMTREQLLQDHHYLQTRDMIGNITR